MNRLDDFFSITKRGSTLRREITGGLATFMTMAYIIFVQPQVMKAAGMDTGAVFTATCLASALACFIMGIAANFPIAQAPLMGENFFFVYAVVLGMGISWQRALGLVFLSGIVFLLLNLTKIRALLVNSIPDSLKYAISAGIGLFITFLGMKDGGLIVPADGTIVKLGPVTSFPVLITIIGLLVMWIFMARKKSGAILAGMAVCALIAWCGGLMHFDGAVSMPPSLAPTFMQLDLHGLFHPDMISPVVMFLFLAVFDTLGTLVGVGIQGGFVKDGKFEGVERAMISDSVATAVGACLGTSTVSSYIESATGVAQVARTGLAAVTVGILFLLSLFLSPLLGAIDVSAAAGSMQLHPITAPALIIVGALMMNTVRLIHWDDVTEYFPAFLTLAMIPFTGNIADGIAAGFIAYPLGKTATGRAKEVSVSAWIVAIIFVLRYLFFK